MSRKHSQKDPIGFVFDVQSNTVMAQGGSYENMKEKIHAVRAIVPNKSNNEIILVLQHFDNCVDRTVQAFMEGNAVEVLKEWTVLGKKKNKKKKSKPKPEAPAPSSTADGGKSAPNEGEQSATPCEKGGLNGYHVNGTTNDTESVDSLSESLDVISLDARELEDSEPSTPDVTDHPASTFENGRPDLELKLTGSHRPQTSSHQKSASSNHKHTNKTRSGSMSSSQSLNDDGSVSSSKKQGANIEKSVKDLQRCSVSLARYRMVVKEEMDASIKKMKQVFAELQSCLMDREVTLLGEMDKVKAEAMDILGSRQKKAEELKKLTDVAVRMSEEQLAELRADIKHFVSERKYDEELGRAARFTADLETLKKSIDSFGQVSHPRNSYSIRSRCCSLTSPSDVSAPSTPVQSSAQNLPSSYKKATTPGDTPTTASHYVNRQNQPPRQGPPMNKRPGQVYRPQGPRQNYHNNLRYDNRNRNSSWYHTGPRNQSYHPQAQRQPNDRPSTNVSGSNGPAAASELAPTSGSDPDIKALPQRKPRGSQATTS
uniref:Spermatosis associated serine rich 2 n=1 Tax=Leptobrachium leishanense TaxID=445787 RepID=A0A8C5P9S4_9ANUR